MGMVQRPYLHVRKSRGGRERDWDWDWDWEPDFHEPANTALVEYTRFSFSYVHGDESSRPRLS